MYRPNTNLPGLFNILVVRISYNKGWYRKDSNLRVSFIYICITPNTLWFLSMIVSAYGLPEEADLVLIMYWCSVKLFLNLWPMNSLTWSYMITTGHGYQTIKVGLTNFANRHLFLIVILCYLKPPGYGLYDGNGF